MRRTRNGFLALAAAGGLLLAACGGGGGDTTEPAPTTETSSSAPVSTDTETVPATSTTLELTAPTNSATTGFAETELSAPADTEFVIHFVNDDPGIPHNVQIFEGTETTGTPVFAPEDNELITGPDEVDYEIPALPAGTYTYNCVVHATAMVGTLTVQ
jgi:plastocyanin